MSWEDLSAPPGPSAAPPQGQPVWPDATTAARATASTNGFSLRRGFATALLATGLLAIGGVAVVNAADPSTSPSPSEATTPDASVAPDGSGTAPAQTDGSGTQPDRQGRGGHAAGDCPNNGGDQGTTDGTTPDPVPSPSSTTDDSDV